MKPRGELHPDAGFANISPSIESRETEYEYATNYVQDTGKQEERADF
jgi:hypothetical protein